MRFVRGFLCVAIAFLILVIIAPVQIKADMTGFVGSRNDKLSISNQRVYVPKTNIEYSLLDNARKNQDSVRKKTPNVKLATDTVRKTARKCARSHSDEGQNCFTDCLAESIPPDVILACAEACANHNWGQCAACLGYGTAVVIACAVRCYPEEF
jgi:hypothetical protein